MEKQKIKHAFKKTIINIGLLTAMLATIAYAFVTFKDSKTNSFNLGSVNLALQEENWDAEAGKDLLTGSEITKDPKVVNQGLNKAHCFVVVKVPTATYAQIEDLSASDSVSLGTKNVTVYSYGFQEGYKNKTNAIDIWEAYVGTDDDGNIDYSNMFGEKETDLSERVRLFSFVDANTGNESTKWTVLSTYQSQDGNDYIVYQYNSMVNASGETGDETSNLFTKIKLNDIIGEPAATHRYSNGGKHVDVLKIFPSGKTYIAYSSEGGISVGHNVYLDKTSNIFYITPKEGYCFDEDTETELSLKVYGTSSPRIENGKTLATSNYLQLNSDGTVSFHSRDIAD